MNRRKRVNQQEKVKEIQKKLICFWHKEVSDYKPHWVCLAEKLTGWNSDRLGEIIDDLLYDDADLKFDKPYKVEITITLKEVS